MSKIASGNVLNIGVFTSAVASRGVCLIEKGKKHKLKLNTRFQAANNYLVVYKCFL